MRKPILAGLFLCISATAFADEGMWTFDNFPAQTLQQKYGVAIDQKWLDHVRAGAVRLAGGCSASVVSPDGLVLTNHHCVSGCVQALSTPQNDYIKAGFSAARRGDEKQCPGTQAEILETIGDVTGTINEATAARAGQDFTRARDAAIANLEKQSCSGKERTHRCQIVTLYDGGQYKLHTYRRYADVRLVFAPEFAAAFFGGDPDNFNFPRYDLDFSFLRLYDNGTVVKTPEHLTWNAAAPKDGEPVFVAGNPGGTDRQMIADELVTLRDVVNPLSLVLNSELRGRITRYAQEGTEQARIGNSALFGLENGLKSLRGQQDALLQPSLIETKRKADAELKAKVAADANLRTTIGDPWADIAKAQIERVAMYKPYYFIEARDGYGSRLYGYAKTLVRAAEERGKPNGERLREYGDARLPLVQRQLLDRQPVYPDLEQLRLEFWLTKLREELTADAPETALVLGKDSPETLARALIQSKLADPDLRRRLWDGGMQAIAASDDPMIRFVRKFDAAGRALRKTYEERVSGPSAAAYERIAKARFAAYGTSVYPDATFSLRLTYGKITGWNYRGRAVPSFTNFAGLYERATGQFPYALDQRWIDGKGKLDLATVYNMSSDNDIIGGNSGSPLINAKGDMIGAVFDGNIHSLGGDFFFDAVLNRTVSVSTAAMTEALIKIYGRNDLVAELTGR